MGVKTKKILMMMTLIFMTSFMLTSCNKDDDLIQTTNNDEMVLKGKPIKVTAWAGAWIVDYVFLYDNMREGFIGEPQILRDQVNGNYYGTAQYDMINQRMTITLDPLYNFEWTKGNIPPLQINGEDELYTYQPEIWDYNLKPEMSDTIIIENITPRNAYFIKCELTYRN